MIYWVELHARAGQGDEVLRVLQALCTTTRAEPGALMYGLHRVGGDADRIVLYERYRDEQAAAFHMQSAPVQQALRVFEGLLREPPTLRTLQWEGGFGFAMVQSGDDDIASQTVHQDRRTGP